MAKVILGELVTELKMSEAHAMLGHPSIVRVLIDGAKDFKFKQFKHGLKTVWCIASHAHLWQSTLRLWTPRLRTSRR